MGILIIVGLLVLGAVLGIVGKILIGYNIVTIQPAWKAWTGLGIGGVLLIGALASYVTAVVKLFQLILGGG